MVFIPHVPHATDDGKGACCGKKRTQALVAGLVGGVAAGLAAFLAKERDGAPATGDPSDSMNWLLVILGVAVLALGVSLVVILKQKVDR